MASRHTEKYLLNQWEGSDQVLRMDFNEDNLKIEKALSGLAAGLAGETAARERAVAAEAAARAGLELRRLLVCEAEAVTNVLHMELGGVDWSAWRVVHALITPKISSGGYYDVYLNYDNSYRLAREINRPVHVLLYPMGLPTMPTHGLCWGGEVDHFSFTALPFQALEKISISRYSSATQILAGSKIELWGQK